MKKLFILFPLFAFSFYYPLNYKFKFIHSCMQNSSLIKKKTYCECVYDKITSRFTYRYFSNESSSKEVLDFLKKSSKECLQKLK